MSTGFAEVAVTSDSTACSSSGAAGARDSRIGGKMNRGYVNCNITSGFTSEVTDFTIQ